MSPEVWNKIGEIFEAATEVASPVERAHILAEMCGGDVELQAEVEKLLRQDAEAEDLLSAPLLDNSGIHVFAEMIENHDPMIDRRIGVYRLTKEIGRGGMGAVYLAERADGSFRQCVAVKLIKRGMDTDFILRRFRQERQILASLNHPNIARLLDGTTADGLPFFVMEYVEGKSLYKFSDERKLSITERLRLFRRICDALEFAHRNQIIHRDIKPPNILVTNEGEPKLLDFGIAKVFNPEIGFDTIDPTATAMRLMTPEYASPEQVCGATVSPASDIYSLGVLLYELLTGHRPYRFPNRAPHEIARVICEEEPDRPSTGITREDNLLPTGASEATTLADIYHFRGAANIEVLQKELTGDLEKIILKCLRKEPSERYQSAAETAADITRYLNGKPVAAENFYPTYEVLPENPDNSAISAAPLFKISAAPSTDGEKSIAVLPLKIFSSPSETGDEEFLGIGLADALVTRLSNVQRLPVRPTSSVLPFTDYAASLFEAGRILDVNYILDGNIRRVGERIRVTVQLLNIADNSSRWAESFNENLTDVLELEDSISEQIIKSLLPFLSGDEEKQLKKRGTDNPEAYEAYLRGRFYWNTFNEEGFAKALLFYNQAVAIAPDYALAYAGIADYYNLLGVYAVMPTQETSAAAKEAAQTAIEFDENLAEGYAALGFAVLMHDFDWAKAEEYLRRAVELNPNYITGRIWLSYFLGLKADWNESLTHVRRAYELDPHTPVVSHALNMSLYFAGRIDEAITATEQFIIREPRYAPAQIFLSSMFWKIGRAAEAVNLAERAIGLLGRTPYTLCWLGSAYAADGNAAKAREIIAEIGELAKRRYSSPFLEAMIYANLNDEENTLEQLEKALEIRDGKLVWLGVEPQFERFRHLPRYRKILQATKNPLVRRENG